MGLSESLNEALLRHWALLESRAAGSRILKVIDGHNLDIATVVLVARYVVTRAINLQNTELYI